jgi:mRNA-degrading endonuclease RelE of RelBE toxin-antitoxin system
MDWNISYYKTNSGKVPVIDYIETQEPERISKIRNSLRLLRQFGIAESQLNARKLRGVKYKGIHKLKIDSSRIIYFSIPEESLFYFMHLPRNLRKLP